MGEWIGCVQQPADEDSRTADDYTYIHNTGIATVNGKITKIQIFVDAEITGNFEVAVFSKANGNFTDEHSIAIIGAVAVGYHEFLDGVDFDKDDLPIVIGEYVGFYCSAAGKLEKKTTDGAGYWYDSGDQIGDSGVSVFNLTENTHDMQFRVWVEEDIGGYSITAEPGSYIESGQAAGVRKDSKLDIGAGAYAEAGQIATLLKDSKLAIGTGSYALTGQEATLLRELKLLIESGVFEFTGKAVNFLYGRPRFEEIHFDANINRSESFIAFRNKLEEKIAQIKRIVE